MSHSQRPDARPNIILINCDDLGYGDPGCYGSTCHETPALDRLAAEGIRFTDFYMMASVCSPSRAGMMTGCYPRRVGLADGSRGWVLYPGDPHGLHPDEVTIARLLQSHGYATRLVGKWHLGDQSDFLPTRHGFDGYYGLPYSNDMGIWVRKPDVYPPLPLLRDETVIQQQPEQASLTERYVEDAVRFIRAQRERPFFLYFAHMYVHTPIYTSERFMRHSRNGAYGAAVACIDWSVATLLHTLRELGLEENTLVVFTSDNGCGKPYGGSNAPLRGHKGSTWEGGFRLPCIMRWPGVIPAGSTCREMAAAMDFFPTFAGVAGAALPGDRVIDGKDILPLMRHDPDARSPHEAFFYYFRNDLRAVRAGQWKLHLQEEALYDLEADVGEEVNVYADHAGVVRELEERAAACRAELGDAATGVEGSGCRPVGKVDNPVTLTQHDPEHPYLVAIYD